MSAVSRHLARRCAAQALYQWLVTRQSPADIEASFISDDEMEGCDVDYFRHLILNIPNYQSQIQEALAECVDRPVDQIDPVERAILLIGGYEILFRLDIPAGVAIDEAIQVAHTFGSDDSYRFINGVLDRLAGSQKH
ncbi:MAG: transcription antitermination factor NusB [Gammaproteobacteria bacterium]|jgi:N utilization substance protein B|nr:transcription antitermination factor NusB [Gammaproteobacteria bacterium]NDA15256.1 transcription antitermination factor NusB [Gammaproteobacteria bacterium]NDG44667.1 transcription antitermination factor NusB [Gammaproteobacteria bacterium]